VIWEFSFVFFLMWLCVLFELTFECWNWLVIVLTLHLFVCVCFFYFVFDCFWFECAVFWEECRKFHKMHSQRLVFIFFFFSYGWEVNCCFDVEIIEIVLIWCLDLFFTFCFDFDFLWDYWERECLTLKNWK
jgi:hypothetical protein